jgi:hypothetical protein
MIGPGPGRNSLNVLTTTLSTSTSRPTMKPSTLKSVSSQSATRQFTKPTTSDKLAVSSNYSRLLESMI